MKLTKVKLLKTGTIVCLGAWLVAAALYFASKKINWSFLTKSFHKQPAQHGGKRTWDQFTFSPEFEIDNKHKVHTVLWVDGTIETNFYWPTEKVKLPPPLAPVMLGLVDDGSVAWKLK